MGPLRCVLSEECLDMFGISSTSDQLDIFAAGLYSSHLCTFVKVLLHTSLVLRFDVSRSGGGGGFCYPPLKECKLS